MATDERLLTRMSDRLREGEHQAATQDFCDLLKGGVRPTAIGREVITAASPFLNVPAHTMLTTSGEIRPVNYDHTILGFWRSYQMAQKMPRGYAQLPLVQAMWYLPQGLDIWSQILCEFPGHYAREQEKCPTINLQGPRQHFEEHAPYTDGSFDERLRLMVDSIMQGDRVMAFRSFLGLADEAIDDAKKRRTLESNVLFTAIIDLPGPRSVPIHIVNSAHKAIRARAMVDLANTLGWEHSYPLFLVVIPDIASNPRFHDIFETANIRLTGAFGRDYHERQLTNQDPLSQREAEEYITVMHHGSPDETIAHVTSLLERGKSLVALNDVCITASARLQSVVEHPSLRAGFTNTDHCFDYANVVGFWLRNYDHQQQIKAPYFTSLFVNDTARFMRNRGPDHKVALTSQPEEHADRADRLALGEILVDLAQACDEQEAPYASALLESYLGRTRERDKLIQTLMFESAKFEGDPHMPRNAMSHFEEYHQSTLLPQFRDDIFRSWTRFVSRWHKRSYDHECMELYESELLSSSGNVRPTFAVPDGNRYGS